MSATDPADLSWQDSAACIGADVSLFFPDKTGRPQDAKRKVAEAKAICAGCEVRSECLQFALDNREQWGVYGGLTPTERRPSRRKLEPRLSACRWCGGPFHVAGWFYCSPACRAAGGAAAPRVAWTARTVIGFSAKTTAHLVGITYRQLDYWDRIDLVSPSLAPAKGSGSRRRYSLDDVCILRVLSIMRGHGFLLAGLGPLADDLRLGPWQGCLFVSWSGRCARHWSMLAGDATGFVVDLTELRGEMLTASGLARVGRVPEASVTASETSP